MAAAAANHGKVLVLQVNNLVTTPPPRAPRLIPPPLHRHRYEKNLDVDMAFSSSEEEEEAEEEEENVNRSKMPRSRRTLFFE